MHCGVYIIKKLAIFSPYTKKDAHYSGISTFTSEILEYYYENLLVEIKALK